MKKFNFNVFKGNIENKLNKRFAYKKWIYANRIVRSYSYSSYNSINRATFDFKSSRKRVVKT